MSFRLIDNIGTLASIYHKPPEAFIKKLRDSMNKLPLDEDDDKDQEAGSPEVIDSSGMKISEHQGIARNEYTEAIKNKGNNISRNSGGLRLRS